MIRPAGFADAGAISAIYAAVVTDTAISFEEEPPSSAEMVRRMLAAPRLPWLVAVDAGRVLGYAYASQHRQRRGYRWSADCSAYVEPAHRSRGIGRLLYDRLIAEVAELGYRSLFAGIALPNPASVRLHEAVGFEPIGVFREVGFKFGGWRDVGWWRRELPALPSPPPEPREWRPA